MADARSNDAARQPLCAQDMSFDTRTEAHAALHALVANQSATLLCFSADFSGWPLQQSAFIRQLELWALRDPRRHAALRMLVVDWSTVRLRFARFAAFRRDFAHLIDCRQISERQASGLHEMAWTPSGAVCAHTATWMSAEQWHSAPRLHALRLGFEDAWEKAVPAFPAITLGL